MNTEHRGEITLPSSKSQVPRSSPELLYQSLLIHIDCLAGDSVLFAAQAAAEYGLVHSAHLRRPIQLHPLQVILGVGVESCHHHLTRVDYTDRKYSVPCHKKKVGICATPGELYVYIRYPISSSTAPRLKSPSYFCLWTGGPSIDGYGITATLASSLSSTLEHKGCHRSRGLT